MSAPKLTWTERVIAGGAAAPFQPIKAALIVRNVVKAAMRMAVLVLAAQQCGGWLSLALYVMAALSVAPFLLIGIGQRAIDERAYRLSLLTSPARHILKDKTRIYGSEATK